MDVTEATELPPAANDPARRKAYWLAAGAVALVLVIGWLIRGRDSSEATVTVLPPGHIVQAMPGPVLDRLIPIHWSWLRKLRSAVFGKPAAVEVEHVFFQFRPDAEEMVLQTLKAPSALVTSNGVSAWVIKLDDAAKLKSRFMQHSGAVSRVGRVVLGAGVVASVSSTTGTATADVPVPPGMSSTYAVRPRGNGIEILGAFASWDVMTNGMVAETRELPVFTLETNLAMAVSMFVPAGKAVYLHRAGTGEARRSSTAVLVLPRVK